MSVLGRLVRRPARRLPSAPGTLEELAQRLAAAGASEAQSLRILRAAAVEIERAQVSGYDATAAKQRLAAELAEVGREGATARWWRLLGWTDGAPDGSGPLIAAGQGLQQARTPTAHRGDVGSGNYI